MRRAGFRVAPYLPRKASRTFRGFLFPQAPLRFKRSKGDNVKTVINWKVYVILVAAAIVASYTVIPYSMEAQSIRGVNREVMVRPGKLRVQ